MTWQTIQVLRYFIGDDDEGIHEADNPQDFDDSCALLERLRDENPENTYTLCAEVDAYNTRRLRWMMHDRKPARPVMPATKTPLSACCAAWVAWRSRTETATGAQLGITPEITGADRRPVD